MKKIRWTVFTLNKIQFLCQKATKSKGKLWKNKWKFNLNFSTRIFLLSDKYNMFSSEGKTKVWIIWAVWNIIWITRILLSLLSWLTSTLFYCSLHCSNDLGFHVRWLAMAPTVCLMTFFALCFQARSYHLSLGRWGSGVLGLRVNISYKCYKNMTGKISGTIGKAISLEGSVGGWISIDFFLNLMNLKILARHNILKSLVVGQVEIWGS